MENTLRFTVCTLNLWERSRWPERRASLEAFLSLHKPDILCLQELRPETRDCIDSAFTGSHSRIDDAFEGWVNEGNIYWNRTLFEKVTHGAEDVGMSDSDRRLFWATLKLHQDPSKTLLVSTAHFTWPGHERELITGTNQRIPQARKTAETLQKLSTPNEPQLFMGDLNDQYLVLRILRESGLKDIFTALGRMPRATRPAAPTYHGNPETVDWMFFRGEIRPMTAEVVDFFLGDIAPSDHKPVLATFCWNPLQPAKDI